MLRENVYANTNILCGAIEEAPLTALTGQTGLSRPPLAASDQDESI